MGDAVWDERAPGRKPTPKPTPQPEQPPAVNVPIRVTDERDGELLNRGYAYYSQSWVDRNGAAFLFVGHADGRPRFFRVDPSGLVTRIGPMLGYAGTAEGWSWSHNGEIYLCDGPRLRRVNPFTGSDHVVMDITGSHASDCRLWQAHSSDDGLTHSATVQKIVPDGAYPNLGTLVQRAGGKMFVASPMGTLDESHITADGSHVIIEESHNNRIIDLATGAETGISNAAGALAHIDCGPGYAVGEDDQAGACTYLDLRTLERRELFSTNNMGHVSVRSGKCLLSDATSISLVNLDGSGVTRLAEHGMRGEGYDYQVHGNLSPDGRVAAWVSNAAGRMDLYVVWL